MICLQIVLVFQTLKILILCEKITIVSTVSERGICFSFRVSLGFTYFIEIEKFFVKNIVDKVKC